MQGAAAPLRQLLLALVAVADVLVLLAGAVAVPELRAGRDRPPREPTAAQAVAHLERTWARIAGLPGGAGLGRVPGVEQRDDCGIGGPRTGAPVADDGRRSLRWVSEPLGIEALDLLARVRRALVALGHGPRPSAGSGEALGDAYGYAWLLRSDGQRAVVTASTPCLRAAPP